MKFQMSQMQENVGVHMDNRKTGLVSWSMSSNATTDQLLVYRVALCMWSLYLLVFHFNLRSFSVRCLLFVGWLNIETHTSVVFELRIKLSFFD